MGTALDMVVCNTWFKKRDSRLITYSSGVCNTQIDYIHVSQHRIVVPDVKIKPCNAEKQPFVPKRRAWKLNERDVENVTERVDVEDHVEDLWKSLKDDL